MKLSLRASMLFAGAATLATLAVSSDALTAPPAAHPPVFAPPKIDAPSANANPSELLFRRFADGSVRPHAHHEDGNPNTAGQPLTASFKGTTRAPRWNVLREQAEPRLALGARQATLASLGLTEPGPITVKKATFDGAPACTAPDLMVMASNCCSYSVTNQLTGDAVMYRRPKHAFSDEASAIALAKSVRASMPMSVPYRDSDVRLGQGWIYESGGYHGAGDYGRASYTAGVDPSFKVYAVADGKVIATYWDDLMGNIVVIEHKAPNGDRYRSLHAHMRNGFDHDLAKARALNIPADKRYVDGKPTRPWKYKQYADKPNPSQLQWGTNAQTIQVKLGDTIHLGQWLGWSGNTGDGGAGNGLDDTGNPVDPITANNHHHYMLAVPHPTAGEKEWVQVDPYGVYAKLSTGCYELGDDTAFVRLIAPFHSSFHNVPVEYVAKYFGYYPGMGMGLQTLSVHKKDSKVLASGAFLHGIPSDWYARFWMSGADYQYWFTEYDKQGYRPRQIQVAPDPSGTPRFNVIWQRRSGESYVAMHDADESGWNGVWKEWVDQKGYRVEDRVAYSSGGTQKYAVVFVKDGAGFYELHKMDGAAFQAKFDDLWGKGYRTTSISILDNGSSYGGVWRAMPGYWVTQAGLSASGYQDKFSELASQGYRLHRVEGYQNSSRFAAIWTK